MNSWERQRSYRRGRDTANHPSFSSSLLDAIYRSIDEGDGRDNCKGANKVVGGGGEPELASIRKQHQFYDHHHAAAVVEKKKKNTTTTTTTTVTEKFVLHRRGEGVAVDNIHRRPPLPTQQQRDRYTLNSTSSSSESSYGGFSSSETESMAALSSVRTRPPPVHRPTAPLPVAALEAKKKPKQEESPSSIRSRFRASRIYGEQKNAKSPVSPGGRLASFLNSLFASAGHPKKAKLFSSSFAASSVPSAFSGSVGGGEENSTCSSASSYSRSCLSKTPSSRGKPAIGGGGAKRSVKFYPMSVVVGDDCRPCGEKSLYDDYTFYDREYARRDQAAVAAKPVRARNPTAEGKSMRDLMLGIGDDKEMEEDEEDDAASYSSSDLFELESLSAIERGGGGERYGDELPVYETTHFCTNRAIAQGLIV